MILVGLQERYWCLGTLQVELIDDRIRVVWSALEGPPCAFSNRAGSHQHVRARSTGFLILVETQPQFCFQAIREGRYLQHLEHDFVTG